VARAAGRGVGRAAAPAVPAGQGRGSEKEWPALAAAWTDPARRSPRTEEAGFQGPLASIARTHLATSASPVQDTSEANQLEEDKGMAAKFFWDMQGKGKTPDGAKALMGDTRARGYLSDYWAGGRIPNSIQIPSDQAILMSGTTAELQQALATDISKGINAIGVESSLACWYFRWSNFWKTETYTLVSIASKEGYWGFGSLAGPNRTGYYWYDLYQGTSPYKYGNVVALQDLSQDPLWLPTVKGVKAWY
jgi:hypothetical protein